MVDTLWGVNIKVSYIKQATIRNTSYVIDLLGERNIGDYSTADVGNFRSWLTERQLIVSSALQVLGAIRSIINLCNKK